MKQPGRKGISVGMRVVDGYGRSAHEGTVMEISSQFEDGLPAVAKIRYDSIFKRDQWVWGGSLYPIEVAMPDKSQEGGA